MATTIEMDIQLPVVYEANVIEKIKRNNVELTVTDKTVNIEVPTKTSELTNDSGYITTIAKPTITFSPVTEITTKSAKINFTTNADGNNVDNEVMIWKSGTNEIVGHHHTFTTSNSIECSGLSNGTTYLYRVKCVANGMLPTITGFSSFTTVASPIPNEYQCVEWFQPSDTGGFTIQYDTPLSIKDLEMEYVANIVSTAGTGAICFGYNSPNYFRQFYVSGGTCYFDIFGDSTRLSTNISIYAGTYHTYKFGNRYIMVDGSILASASELSTETTYNYFKFFAEKHIYKKCFLKYPNVYLHKLYPVRRIADNYTGFFDIVTQTFHYLNGYVGDDIDFPD